MKYLVNNSAISYKFLNGTVLHKQSAQVVDENILSSLKEDFQFNALIKGGMVAVTENRPENLMSAGEKLAEKDAEISALKAKLAKLEGKVEKAEALGTETDVTVDTETDTEETVAEKTSSKRATSKKK